MITLKLILLCAPFLFLYAYFLGLFFSKVKKVHTGFVEWICVLFYLRVELGVHRIRVLFNNL